MLIIGRQISAARALVDIDQEGLAKRARIGLTTIKAMEKRGTEPIHGRAETVRRIQFALEDMGVEFLNHGQPGVRVALPRPPRTPNSAMARNHAQNQAIDGRR